MSLYCDIHKNFGNFNLDVTLNVGDETLAILGASGCGKSLTLACIAGIVKPDKGRIILNNKVIFDSEKKINVSIQKRNTGLMFQNYALFPNMTVEKNISISQKIRSKTEINELLCKFGLDDVKNLYPSQISGGQQQRAALARMLLSRPEILMLDEPFSALDSHLRFQMENELFNIFRNFFGTVILISHNRDEAFRLCDRIAIIHNGRIETEGKKDNVFKNPETKYAAILTGCKNISRSEKINTSKIFASDWGIELDCNKNYLDSNAKFVGIRMHGITHGSNEKNCFECRVIQVIENPFSYNVKLIPVNANKNLNPINWELDKNLWLKIKSEFISVCFPPENIMLLKE